MSLLTNTMIKLAVFYVTAPSKDVALKLCDVLLSHKLIACCNIVQNIESVYLWKGKIQNDKQVLMIMKSRQQLAEQITKTVITNHPYDTPEVIAMPIITGSAKYLDWVIQSTKKPNQSIQQQQNKNFAKNQKSPQQKGDL